MCGIAGIFSEDASLDSASEAPRLDAALQRIRHRGPDDQGVFTTPSVILGNVRLSILDLSASGHQPMTSRDGRLTVTFNGEIYNYLELRKELEPKGHRFETGSDTEVLLSAYSQWGLDCLTRFRGMFAFALWDTVRRHLVLARDRVGEKPFYYARSPGRLVFASELKALLELMPGRASVSAGDVDAFLHYQFTIEPGSLLSGVRKLPAGHYMVLGEARGASEPRKYWDLIDAAPIEGDPTTRVREALESAVEVTLRSDAPVGVALSGGLDSSAIAALAVARKRELTAFSVGYPGQHHFDERGQARDLANRLGLPWHGVELRTEQLVEFFPRLVAAMDEPIGDVAAYGHYAVARLAADHGIKVLLTGIGGDELFFGYGWVRDALRLSRLKIDIESRGSTGAAIRARLARALLGTPSVLRLLVNHRLPGWWRAAVNRALDDGRLDLDHPDEWVFYQLDYHWAPAERDTAALYTGSFRRQIPARSAYRLMQGLGGDEQDAQVAIANLLFDSWLVANCLALGDRVAMASSVETRVPLLDTQLVETVVGLWKAGRTEDSDGHKLWLRSALRGLLPSDVIDRPKLGFVTPTMEWIQAVNDRYDGDLRNGVLVDTNVIDPDRLRGWLDRGSRSIHREFFRYKLTLLEMWHRTVVG